MAGASFSMPFGKANRFFGNALQAIGNRQQLAETLGEQLVSSTIQRFEDEEDPEGNAWPKSRRAEEEGGQTLSDKGHLKGSVNYEASPTAVAVGTTDKVKGAIHQFGGTIKPKSKKALKFKTSTGFVMTKKVEMPKRSYIGINEDDIDESQATIALFMQQGLGVK